MVVLSANKTAITHLLGSMAFAKNSINPNTVRLKPRTFNNKGKANRAPNVKRRFFQFISENAKIGFSFSPTSLRLERIRFDNEKIPSRRAARKGTRADPGSLKLPKDASAEEISMTPATNNKKMLLIWSFLSFIIDDPIEKTQRSAFAVLSVSQNQTRQKRPVTMSLFKLGTTFGRGQAVPNLEASCLPGRTHLFNLQTHFVNKLIPGPIFCFN